MSNSKQWTKLSIPQQSGSVAIVTGATGGLGYETALVLAEAGSTVILAGRNETKGKDALEKINSLVPSAKISFEKVDLGSLESVTNFCERFHRKYKVLDLLINNAGVMAPTNRETTSDGFELQFGTNHLAHFALTAQLLPALRRSMRPRVVNVSSWLHRPGSINFVDLQSEKNYRFSGLEAYCQSKLCNLLFTMELQKKSEENGWGLVCTAAHPGYARTNLFTTGLDDRLLIRIAQFILNPFVSQSAEDGALTILYAATAPGVTPGGFYGPSGFNEMRGPPSPAYMTEGAKDANVAKKLWDVSTNLSNVSWPLS